MAIDSIARALSGQANKVATDAIAAAEEAIHTATEQIPSIVTNWLDDNVTPVGSAVVVDSSLSISGAAADAKATGDGLTDLKNAIDQLEYNDVCSIDLNKAVAGTSISGSVGSVWTTTGNTPYRGTILPPMGFGDSVVSLTISANYRATYRTINESTGIILEDSGWLQAGTHTIQAESGKVYGFLFSKVTESGNALTVSDIVSNYTITWKPRILQDASFVRGALEFKQIPITHLYNGSTQNSGNTTAIHTGGYSTLPGLIPVSSGDIIDIVPLKPLASSSYHYVFGYTTYTTNTTSPTSVRNMNFSSSTTHDVYFPLTIGNGEYYLGITIAAYDSGGNSVTLRTTDFTVDDFLLYWSRSDEQIFRNKSVEVIRPDVVIRNGSDGNQSNTTDVHIGGLSIDAEKPFLIPVEEDDLVQLSVTKPVQNTGNRYGYSARIGNASYSVTRHFGLTDIGVSLDQLIRVKSGEKYIAYTIRELKADGTTATLRANQLQSPQVGVFIYRGKNIINVLDNKLSRVSKYVAQTPLLRNGSLGNSSNENAICMTYNLPSFGAESVCMHWDIDFQGADPQFIMKTYSVYTETQQTSDATNQIANYTNEIPSDLIKKISDKDYIVSIDGCAAFSFGVFDRNGNSYYPLRTSNHQGALTVTYNYGSIAEEGFGYDVLNKINTSRKLAQTATNNGLKPLTLLHFSDIHDDKTAFGRIEQYANFYGDTIDDVICTGDMVGNSGGQTGAALVNWWNPKYLTCVGNHDSATYNSSAMTYNWTGVTMAQRDAYYIAPFESNWGITHTSGTSYYYKDYTDAKVRLIVIDCMLYHGTPGSEATTQTSWLGTAMDGAKSLGYHILIATHAPHTGAIYKDCTFNRYGYSGAYPSFPDGVQTPQAVTDLVATKIAGGCVFIGYIIGHTHQDYMLDANNDGKQMMYCVTCAAVTQTAQWQGSDQWRDSHADAFNVVTVDTDARMVKIVRGGGANVDNRMRNRTQICFHYGDGVIVGQDN